MFISSNLILTMKPCHPERSEGAHIRKLKRTSYCNVINRTYARSFTSFRMTAQKVFALIVPPFSYRQYQTSKVKH
ncbi:MAG: hypothetical protein DME98_01670 [Verrucomicrobia bacterium]|nr:MAG: hypothetical protein DME98_01670 [Verrucomicrobiota bacterium]PYJ32660.1 MAG: hypothetical protein DME88_10295 [Verrucomicrobiota bacterium]